MIKLKFAKILLSRYLAENDEGQHHLISCLILADSELNNRQSNPVDFRRIEDTKEFEEWAVTIMEALFPEEMGELISLEDWNG
jgi:hypothetical protein